MAIIEGLFQPHIKITPDKPIEDQLHGFRRRRTSTRRFVETGFHNILQMQQGDQFIEKGIEVAPDGSATVETNIFNTFHDKSNGVPALIIGKRMPDQLHAVFVSHSTKENTIVKVYYHVPGVTPVFN